MLERIEEAPSSTSVQDVLLVQGCDAKLFGLFVCLFVWLVGCLVGWLFGLLVCLFVWLVGWLVTAGGCCCWFRATSTMNVVSNLAAN